MIYKVKKYILMLILTVFSVLTFAELPQAPNTLITENPDREVTTIEAPKNREHAEMNITVNKINIQEIEGIELPTGEILIFLPKIEEKKDKMRRESVFYVSDAIENFPDISTVNGKKIIANLQKIKDSVVSNGIKTSNYDGITIIDTDKKYGELYIGIVDKLNGETSKIWKIEKTKNYLVKNLKGRKLQNSLSFEISGQKELKEGLKNNSIKFYSLVENEIRNKRSFVSPNLEYTYSLDKYSEAMGVRISELSIKFPSGSTKGIGIDKSKNIIYLLEKNDGPIDPNSDKTTVYSNLEEGIYFKKGGKYYLYLGNFLRVNRRIRPYYADFPYFNFSFDKSTGTKKINFKFWNESTGVSENKELLFDYMNAEEILLAGEDGRGSRDAVIRTAVYDIENLPDLRSYGLRYPKYINEEGTFYGWVLAFKVRFEISEELYNSIKDGKYNKVQNLDRINVVIRGWTEGSDPVTEETILKEKEMELFLVGGGSEELGKNTFVGETVYSNIIGNKFELRDTMEVEILGTRYKISELEKNEVIVNDVGIKVGIYNGKKSVGFVRKSKTSYLKILIKIYDKRINEKALFIYDVTCKFPWSGIDANTTIKLNTPLYGKFGVEETSNIVSRGYSIGNGEEEVTLGDKIGDFWKITFHNIGTRLKFTGDNPNKTIDNNVDVLNWQGPIFNKDGTKVQLSFNGDERGYFEILDWNLQPQNININYETVHYNQNILVKIPAFNGLDYLDKTNVDTGVDYSQKKVTKETINGNAEEIGSFNIRTLYYNLKALGEIDGHSAFAMRIPKSIKLNVTDNIETMEVIINVDGVDNTGTAIKVEKDNFIYFYPKNTGDTSTAMNIKVKIVGMVTSRNINYHTLSYSGSGLGLVELGVDKNGSFVGNTVIDSLDITTKSEIKEENIEFRDEEIGNIKESSNTLSGINKEIMLSINGRAVPTSKLMTEGQELNSLGVKIKYDINTQKFSFEKTKNIGKNEIVEIGIHMGSDGFTPIAKKIRFNVTNRCVEEVSIDLTNPIVKADRSNGFYGRFVITGDRNKNASGYYLDGSGSHIQSSIKNGQFDMNGKVNGKVNTIDSNSVRIRYNNQESEIQKGSTVSLADTGLIVGYSERNGRIEGLDIGLESWNYEAQNIKFSIIYGTSVNRYTINIQKWNGDVYYDYSLDNSNKFDLSSREYFDTKNEIENFYQENILAEIPIGLKDYDIGIYGTRNGNTNICIAIPKKVRAKIKSDNHEEEVELKTELKDYGNAQFLSYGKYYYLHYPNIGNVGSNNNCQGKLVIKLPTLNSRSKLNNKTIIELETLDENIVSVEVNDFINTVIRTPIIKKYKLNIQNNNYEEEFDMTVEKLGSIKLGQNVFALNDNDIVELDEKNSLKESLTGSQLKTEGYSINGLKLKYNSEQRKLEVKRVKGEEMEILYNMVIKSAGIKVREINVKLKNKPSFVIIDNSKLDFGDFFAGDIKFAENIIKFKNNEDAQIKIELKSTTGEMTLDGMATSDPNKKVKLSNFKVWDLDTKNPNESSFRIKGRADTTATTEAGEYKGIMEVIITILPN